VEPSVIVEKIAASGDEMDLDLKVVEVVSKIGKMRGDGGRELHECVVAEAHAGSVACRVEDRSVEARRVTEQRRGWSTKRIEELVSVVSEYPMQ
jgi:hypothetical protein